MWMSDFSPALISNLVRGFRVGYGNARTVGVDGGQAGPQEGKRG